MYSLQVCPVSNFLLITIKDDKALPDAEYAFASECVESVISVEDRSVITLRSGIELHTLIPVYVILEYLTYAKREIYNQCYNVGGNNEQH